MNTQRLFLVCLVGVLILIVGCSKSPTGSIVVDTGGKTSVEAGSSFREVPGEICRQDGKPVIRLFATTWCPHCKWIKDTYTKVVQAYAAKGEIVAYLWEVDIGDNTLTKEKETAVPTDEMTLFKHFNPQGSIPTFVFGCTFVRVGNAFEAQNDVAREEAEFRAVIDRLIEAGKTEASTP